MDYYISYIQIYIKLRNTLEEELIKLAYYILINDLSILKNKVLNKQKLIYSKNK